VQRTGRNGICWQTHQVRKAVPIDGDRDLPRRQFGAVDQGQYVCAAVVVIRIGPQNIADAVSDRSRIGGRTLQAEGSSER
jgi:hypothetical protein